MASQEDFPQTGIIVPRDEDSSDHMNTMAHAILDDVLYNLIHDIVLNTHRQEKMLRANTAGIIIEQLAAASLEEGLVDPDNPTTPKKKRKIVHTKSAVYDDGNVYIVGNPLETTKEIRCAQCGLPRLVSPQLGPAGGQPDPSIEYCQRKPYIDKPGQDIYGQPVEITTRAMPTKKAQAKNIPASTDQVEPGSSFDTPGSSSLPDIHENKIVLPKVACPACKRKISVNRFAKHLFACGGYGGGRASGRAAAIKITEQRIGSQQASTPPLSRKSTPLPPEKKSPQKRDLGELEGDQGDLALDRPMDKKPKKVVEKKSKPGKVTIKEKKITKEPIPDRLGSESVPDSQPHEVSESSQTLSSP